MSEQVAFLFPGQGSQYVGMGSSLYQEFALAKTIFSEAEEITGLPLRQYCFEGPLAQLTRTEIAQPAILTVEYIILRLLKEEGIEPAWVAGHSLGEYAALIAAGALSFAAALALVKKRAAHMAAVQVEGGMAAVLNLPVDRLEKMVQDLQTEGTIVLANYNTPTQIVISGEKKLVNQLVEKIKEEGEGRVVPLEVEGAFHSPIMKPAAENFRLDLKKTSFSALKTPIISNVTAEAVLSSDQLPLLLEKQIYSPVRWTESIEKLASLGCNIFFELGGKILTGMVKKILPAAKSYALRESRDLKKYLQK
ncbi:MAG: ACP S-malonyltransferase [Firmicutes bacterium]|nr:ACP S-malonyltransferase [Bacillota bacterium]